MWNCYQHFLVYPPWEKLLQKQDLFLGSKNVSQKFKNILVAQANSTGFVFSFPHLLTTGKSRKVLVWIWHMQQYVKTCVSVIPYFSCEMFPSVSTLGNTAKH